jgi:hypothetical protein
MSLNHEAKAKVEQEKIAPTGWENALPLRFIDGGAPTRAAVSGYLVDGRELVGFNPRTNSNFFSMMQHGILRHSTWRLRADTLWALLFFGCTQQESTLKVNRGCDIYC